MQISCAQLSGGFIQIPSADALRRQLGCLRILLHAFVHVSGCAQMQVVEGLDIVRQIEQSKTDRMDRPQSPVTISGAGEL